MKPLRLFSFISFFVLSLFFLIGSFSSVGAEEENTAVRKNNCLKCCWSKYEVCRNVYPDARACAASYEACGTTCDSEGEKITEWVSCWTEATDKEAPAEVDKAK